MLQRLKIEHLEKLIAEPSNVAFRNLLSPKDMKAVARNPHSYSVVGSSTIYACGGISPYWSGRGEAWIIFGPEARENLLPLLRLARVVLDCANIRRVEAAVELSSTKGHRLVRALGFEKEAERLRSYLPNGSDCSLYARVG